MRMAVAAAAASLHVLNVWHRVLQPCNWSVCNLSPPKPFLPGPHRALCLGPWCRLMPLPVTALHRRSGRPRRAHLQSTSFDACLPATRSARRCLSDLSHTCCAGWSVSLILFTYLMHVRLRVQRKLLLPGFLTATGCPGHLVHVIRLQGPRCTCGRHAHVCSAALGGQLLHSGQAQPHNALVAEGHGERKMSSLCQCRSPLTYMRVSCVADTLPTL